MTEGLCMCLVTLKDEQISKAIVFNFMNAAAIHWLVTSISVHRLLDIPGTILKIDEMFERRYGFLLSEAKIEDI